MPSVKLTLGSLFDGIGGWQLAAVECGIEPKWASEIDPFPASVTAKHFPDTKQLGDVAKIDGSKVEPVDIICAGSPCQDLSVAGKGAGLAGERSGLFGEAIRIIREMRRATNREYPKWFVWENVYGAFSSNKGADFRTVLEEITESNIPMPTSKRWAKSGLVRSAVCDVAWRGLDAQYWGVPQRRKRIFLVADFRKERRPEVLFESESLCRDFEESQGKGQGIAGCTRESIKATGIECRVENDQSVCIGNVQVMQLGLHEKARTLDCMHEQQSLLWNISAYNSNSMKSNNPYSGIHETDMARTLDVNGGNPACNQGGVVVLEGNGSRPSNHGVAYGFEPGAVSRLGHSIHENLSTTLRAHMGDNCESVVYGFDRAAYNQGKNALYDFSIEQNKAQTLVARGPGGMPACGYMR